MSCDQDTLGGAPAYVGIYWVYIYAYIRVIWGIGMYRENGKENGSYYSGFRVTTIRDNKEYLRVLLYSYDTTITGKP